MALAFVRYARRMSLHRSIAKLQRQVTIAKAERLTVAGIPIVIDRPVGFVQSGKSPAGIEWSRTYAVPYGFIEGTDGGDGEGLDVFVGPDHESASAFWVRQVFPDGSFDEWKLLVGFGARATALSVYLDHVPAQFFGGMLETDVGTVRALLGSRAAVAKALRIASAGLDSMHHSAAVAFEGWSGRVEKAIGGSAGDLALQAGPPNEWSGAIAGLLGSRLQEIEAIWAAMTEDEYAIAETAWSVAFQEEDETTARRVRAAALDLLRKRPELGAMLDREPVAKEWLGRGFARVTKAEQEEERTVLGIVLEPDVVDSQDDTYSADEIRDTAHLFMEFYRNIGLQHRALVNRSVKLVESYLAPIDMTIGGQAVRAGTWLMKVRVDDPDLWARVKAGDFTGFSIGGLATKTPV
jgi:hypothetical protein